MSGIADFRIIKTDKLETLKGLSEIIVKKSFFKKTVIDGYWDFLDENSKKLEDFNWSGYIFANLLIFLQENKGIDLLTSEFDPIANWISEKRGVSVIIFTDKHKQLFMDKLVPENYNESELIAFNKEFSEDESPELAKAEMDGIKAIWNSMAELMDENEVVLLTVA